MLSNVQSGRTNASPTPDPCPPEYTGEHYGKLGLYALAIFLVIAWFFGMYVYGFIIGPNNALVNNPTEPLTTQVDFALIPALPDTLTAEYDALRAQQLAEVNGFQWVDQSAGIARIPVGEAYQRLLEPAPAAP